MKLTRFEGKCLRCNNETLEVMDTILENAIVSLDCQCPECGAEFVMTFGNGLITECINVNNL